jgi:hypothetical protein
MCACGGKILDMLDEVSACAVAGESVGRAWGGEYQSNKKHDPYRTSPLFLGHAYHRDSLYIAISISINIYDNLAFQFQILLCLVSALLLHRNTIPCNEFVYQSHQLAS